MKSRAVTVRAESVRRQRGGAVLVKAVAYSIIAFWVVMAGLFVRREIIPDLFAQPAQGYASIRAYAESHPGYRMGIYLPDGTRLGTAETTLQLQRNGDCEIQSASNIQFPQQWLTMLGGSQPGQTVKMSMWSEAVVGADNMLKTFTATCEAGGVVARASGTVSGNQLKVSVNVAGVRWERVVPITKDDMVSSGLLAVEALPDLHEGQVWEMKSLDPFSFRFSTATARVKRRTRIPLRGHLYTVYEVEVAEDPIVVTSWVTQSGDVLKEQIRAVAFTLELIREPLPHEMRGAPGEAFTTEPGRAGR